MSTKISHAIVRSSASSRMRWAKGSWSPLATGIFASCTVPPRRDGNQVHAAFSEPLSQDDRLLDVPASICPIGCRDSHKQREQPFPWTSRSLQFSVSWRTQDHPRQRVAGHEGNPGFGETGGERRALRRTPLKPKMMRAKSAAVLSTK